MSQSTGQPAQPTKIGMKHSQLSEIVTAELRKDIIDGRYKPGERLVEGRLAESMGVSRIPVREALRGLANEGLVEIRPRHGAVVATLSPDAAREMIEVRAALEGLNARLAARRRAPETITGIQRVLKEAQEKLAEGNIEDLIALNSRFHDVLYDAGNNTVLKELMRSLRERTRVFFWQSTPDDIRKTWEEHEAILRAVAAGDSELAAMLAERHVLHAGTNYLEAASR
jgi:DNA-binding GntR family transcriptional regulator